MAHIHEDKNSDSDSEGVNEEIQKIYALELAPATHEVYKQKLRHFVAYLRRTDPALVIDDTTFNCTQLHLKQIELFLIHKQDDDQVSYGVLESYRTALIYAYHQAKVEMPPHWLKKLRRFFRGLRRKEAQERQDGKRPLTIGKAAMPHRLYKWLCHYFLRKGNLFAWAFLTLSWSSLCRVGSVADILLSHLEPVTDALGLHVPKSKADQGGARAQIAWQVFANADDVAQCPITALAALLTLEGTRSENKLFMGGNQDRRYARDIQLALETAEGKAIMGEVGRAAHSIAPHSTRKGAAAYASNGTLSFIFGGHHNVRGPLDVKNAPFKIAGFCEGERVFEGAVEKGHRIIVIDVPAFLEAPQEDFRPRGGTTGIGHFSGVVVADWDLAGEYALTVRH